MKKNIYIKTKNIYIEKKYIKLKPSTNQSVTPNHGLTHTNNNNNNLKPINIFKKKTFVKLCIIFNITTIFPQTLIYIKKTQRMTK